MNKQYRLLIADDEETFLHSTADVLREHGYHCDCATNADDATELIKKQNYNLLISDINMPGNNDLEFIKAQADSVTFLPVILVTGYPSVQTASDSVQLPVIAYMLKPVDVDELVHWVELGTRTSRSFSSMNNIRLRLREWDKEVQDLQTSLTQLPTSKSAAPVEMFITNSFNNLAGTLLDLNNLISTAVSNKQQTNACHMLNCPRYSELQGAVEDTISTLERTKNSFKSKELGKLRERLTKLLKTDI